MTQTAYRSNTSLTDQSSGSNCVLGKGRAAEVRLICDEQTGLLYAEKVFKSRKGLTELTRDIIYWLCFQSPFPCKSNEDAVYTALYRRKVLRILSEFWFDKPLVADGCYVRWDDVDRCYILGTQYIKGRGPKPGNPDPYIFRNAFLRYPIRFCERLLRIHSSSISPVHWEINDVADWLDKFKQRFHEAGFLGSEWQVDKRLSVPTSNMLKDDSGDWILVDVESAMPALIFPGYSWAAVRFGSFPFFDEIDFRKLRRYLADNSPQMVEKLSKERVEELYSYVNILQYHSDAWKSSELAVFRHRHHLLTDAGLRSNIRARFANYWFRSGRISSDKAKSVSESTRQFILCWHLSVLTNIVSSLALAGRSIGRFLVQFSQMVKLSSRILWASFFNDQYLQEFAELYVNVRIENWQQMNRLTEVEAERLRSRTRSPAVAEYLKGFMVHLSLNLLEPPFIGNIIVAVLAIALQEWLILLVFFTGPILRTLYTLFRMIQKRGSGVSYKTALFVGALPKVGTMAYPIQMGAAHPNLSRFLARWQLSLFACHVPFFGGSDSRLEHFCIRAADIGPSIQFELTSILTKLKSFVIMRK